MKVSEKKRFEWIDNDTISDNQTDEWYCFLFDDIRNDFIDLLNERESLIIKQDEEIKKLKRTERSWRRIHCCNKESDNCGIVIEQQSTITELNKQIEQLRKQVAEYDMILRQQEFAEKEGFR